MRKSILIVVAIGAMIFPAGAGAVMLQRHVVIPHGVTRKDDLHRVVTWHVGLDSDHDGIWNGPDGCAHQAGPRSNGGCKPAPETSITNVAPAAASATVAPSQPVYTSGSANPMVDPTCESGGDYTTNTGNGYGGAYQFDVTTWNAYAPAGYEAATTADIAAAPPSVQDAAAAAVPYDAWPNC